MRICLSGALHIANTVLHGTTLQLNAKIAQKKITLHAMHAKNLFRCQIGQLITTISTMKTILCLSGGITLKHVV